MCACARVRTHARCARARRACTRMTCMRVACAQTHARRARALKVAVQYLKTRQSDDDGDETMDESGRQLSNSNCNTTVGIYHRIVRC